MSRTSTDAEFAYDAFEAPVVVQLKKLANAIGNHTRSGSKSILAIGLALLDAKQPLKHGQFNGWVVSQCGFSIRTAERYMRAAEVLEDKYDTVSHLQPSTIYRLSAKTLPASILNTVLTQLTEKRIVSDNDVNELIDQRLSAEKPAAAAILHEQTPSPLIKAWLEASPSDRLALLNSDPAGFVNGAWQCMGSDDRAQFVRERSGEVTSSSGDSSYHGPSTSDAFEREQRNIIQLFSETTMDDPASADLQCA